MPSIQTLAATFTIVFEGLVAFIGPAPGIKTYAVIVEDKHSGHDRPHMIINGEYFELYKGDHVTFMIDGETHGEAKTKPSFDTRVPTLKEQLAPLTGDSKQDAKMPTGDLKEGVKGKDPKSDGVLAIVTLPDGELHAQGVFNHPIQFKSAENTFTEPCCIARQVRFESGPLDAETRVEITIERANGGPISREVDLNADVHINNTSEVYELHYSVYGNLVTGAKPREVLEDKSHKCIQVGNDVIIGKAARATQKTKGPRVKGPRVTKPRAPRSDCGPTDWP